MDSKHYFTLPAACRYMVILTIIINCVNPITTFSGERENEWTLLLLDFSGELTTAVGCMPHIHEGEFVRLFWMIFLIL